LGIGSAGGPATMSMGELAEAGGLSQAGLNTALGSAAAPMANPELGAGWSDWTNVAPEKGSKSPLGMFPTDGGFTGFLPGMGLTWAAGEFAKKAFFPHAGVAKAPSKESWLNAYSQGLDTVPGWPDFKIADDKYMTAQTRMIGYLRELTGAPNRNILNPTPTDLEQQFLDRGINLNDFLNKSGGAAQFDTAH